MKARHLLLLAALAIVPPLLALGASAPPQDADAWIEFESENFVLLTDTNAEKGERLLRDLESRYDAYRRVVFPVTPRQFKVRVFLLDLRQHFESLLSDAVKTGIDLRDNAIPERSAYLFNGPTQSFIVSRDRPPDEIADDVGHALGHLLLSRSVLWQPFWLQEAVGEWTRMAGRGSGDDPVDADEAYSIRDLLEIVPSETFNDLGDGGDFRLQSYHLFRVLLEDHPEVLANYFDDLGRESGYEAELDLDSDQLVALEARVLGFADRGFPLGAVTAQFAARTVGTSEADAAQGDLAVAVGLNNLARSYYQESRRDEARLGLAVIAKLGGQVSNSRRGFEQLIVELPDSGLSHYHLGTLAAETDQHRRAQIGALERTIDLLPLMGRAYSGLARLYVDDGRPSEALDLTRRAVGMEPEFADQAFEVMADALLALGENDAAREAVQTAATLPHVDPSTLEHYTLLVPAFFRRMEQSRREADATRLEQLRRELESLADERDPRPSPAEGQGIPIGLVHYEVAPNSRPGVQEPRLVSGDLPDYVPDLRRRRIQGQVVFEVDLDRQGRVSATRVRSSDDAMLSAAADAAVRRWRFDPARESEESVPFSFRVTFTFDLQE
jgi:TonB family protein